MRQATVRAACIVGAVFTALFLAEIVLRVLHPWLPKALFLDTLPREAKEMMFYPDERLGVRLKPGRFRAKWKGRPFEIVHTAFLNDSSAAYRTSDGAGSFDAAIVALGDSFTYAAEVPAESTWVARLQTLTKEKSVNLGVRGYGTAQEVEAFRLFGEHFHPRIVLLLAVPNDFEDNRVFRQWRKRQMAGRGDPMMQMRFCRGMRLAVPVCRQVRRAPTLSWLARALFRLSFFGHLGYVPKTVPDASYREMCSDFQELRRLARKSKAKLAVIFEPAWPEWMVTPVRRCLDRHGVPSLRLAGMDRYAEAHYYVSGDDHWNEAGHELAAQQIARFLQDRGWTDAGPNAAVLR